MIHNSGHFGPPLPFWAPEPPALPGLPMASYATARHRYCGHLLVRGPHRSGRMSVCPSVRLCVSLSHRSTAAAAAGGFAAEVWRGQQVLPFLSEYRATRFLHLWQSLSTLFAPPLHLTPMPYRSSANVLVSVMEYWEEQLRRGCLQSSVYEIEGNKAVRSGERRL